MDRKGLDIVYAAIITVVAAACFQLFYKMINDEEYHSDVRFYIRAALDETRPHWKRYIELLFNKLYGIHESTWEINIYMALVIVGVILMNYLVIKFFLNEEGVTADRHLVQLCSIVALFQCPIYVPGFHEYFYRLSFNSFAWHSPTQQSMVLFSLIATLCFLKMFTGYEEGIKPRWWIASAIMIFMSAYAKPNFFMSLAISVVILFVIEMILNVGKDFVRRLWRLFLMGCTLIPAGVYMIILNRIEYGSEESENRVVFRFVNMFDQSHMKAGLLCGIAFALVVCAVNLSLLKDRKYRFSACILFSGIICWFFLHEEGPSAAHGNFTWGRDYGDYFIMLVSISIFLFNLYQRDRLLGGKRIPQNVYFVVAGGLLLLHFLCGLCYFGLILTGHKYYM